MPANVDPTATLGELLAVNADTAARPAGPCCLCRRGILRGQRYARVVVSGRLAHTVCVARMAEAAGPSAEAAQRGRRACAA